MREKLSVKKVYRNAYRYIRSHLLAFLFLTVFYFLGSLLPMFIGTTSFKVVLPIFTYLFFYFAAGCYYKQQILWDKDIFITAGIRFAVAVGLFLTSIVMATLVINVGIYFIRLLFPENGGEFLLTVFNSVFWLLGKYAVIFVLFIVFFVVPSFAFVSEITKKNRSLLTTYAKTKGNLVKIGEVAILALFIIDLTMLLLGRAHFFIAAFLWSAVLVYISILYFKMYDFFYELPQNKRVKKAEDIKENKASDTEKTSPKDTENKRVVKKATKS